MEGQGLRHHGAKNQKSKLNKIIFANFKGNFFLPFFVKQVSEGSCCWSVHPSELYRGPGFSLGRGEARVVPAGAAGSVRMREDGGGCQETAFP